MNDWLGDAIRKVFREGGKEARLDPSLLRLAVAFHRLDLVMFLLRQGADANAVDRRGRTPLFYAASRRMVRTLVEAGANANQTDLMRHRPLHAAVNAGRLDVAKALLQLGSDPHAQDRRGLTPLHAAAAKGRVACIEHLVGQGAWPNVRDRNGRSPLFYAVAAGHLPAALTLIDKGADLTMIDDHGTPWLHLARLDQVGTLRQASDQALMDEEAREWTPGTPDFLEGRLAAEAWGSQGNVFEHTWGMER